jgi:hypothetical protein
VRLPGALGQGLEALVHLDARQDALVVQHLDKRPPVTRALPEGLGEENRAPARAATLSVSTIQTRKSREQWNVPEVASQVWVREQNLQRISHMT